MLKTSRFPRQCFYILFVILIFCTASADVTPDISSRGMHATVSIETTVTYLGTGVILENGNVLTAAHVINDTGPYDFFFRSYLGDVFTVKEVIFSSCYDLALIIPDRSSHIRGLKVSDTNMLDLGEFVYTFGFPAGYYGMTPLLSAGYISGQTTISDSILPERDNLVVNAAFNSGNSGGALFIEGSNEIHGIVVSKLAPFPPWFETVLDALATDEAGFEVNVTNSSGELVSMPIGQLHSYLIDHLRSQVQLVLGFAEPASSINRFLDSCN